MSLELSQETARRSGIRHLTVYGHSYQKREYREALYDRVCPLEKEGVHVLMAHGGDASHIPMDYGKIASGGFDYEMCIRDRCDIPLRCVPPGAE